MSIWDVVEVAGGAVVGFAGGWFLKEYWVSDKLKQAETLIEQNKLATAQVKAVIEDNNKLKGGIKELELQQTRAEEQIQALKLEQRAAQQAREKERREQRAEMDALQKRLDDALMLGQHTEEESEQHTQQ